LSKKHEIEIQWRAFPLHPETPAEGMTLEALFKGRMMDISGMMARLRDVAIVEGLPFGDRNMTYNSRLAQELGKWAEAQGKIEAYNNAVFQAYFARGRNIGSYNTLVEVVGSVDLDVNEARKVLEERPYENAVDADWDRSRQMGIKAVPTFVMDDRMLVGAQPYAALEEFVTERKGRS
jgi:predicted DsbA family dithiol-disulfide isomerase